MEFEWNKAKNTMQPKLAITMGDPAGIGPEIIVKSLNKKENYEKCRPLVCGDAKVMQLAVEKMGTAHKINPIKTAIIRCKTILTLKIEICAGKEIKKIANFYLQKYRSASIMPRLNVQQKKE